MALYNNQMYFGNRNNMQWVPAPQINYESSKRGYVGTATYLNGGQYVRRSSTAAKGYVFTWTLKSRDEIRAINDYADGVYGTGPTYFLDPFAMDMNLLPQYWAVPALGAGDAPMLLGQYDEERPTVLPTSANSLNYPFNTATYIGAGGKTPASMWLPCPPGHSLWFGVHGSGTLDSVVGVTPTIGAAAVGPWLQLPWLSVNDPTRVSTRVNGDQYSGAQIALAGSGNWSISGIMAQCLPNNVTPATGKFISGQGHSGCSFVEEPTLTNYSAGLNRVGIAANLVETEGWK